LYTTHYIYSHVYRAGAMCAWKRQEAGVRRDVGVITSSMVTVLGAVVH
jgi:hypothetical protein